MKDKVKNEMIELLNQHKFITYDDFAQKLNLSLSTTKRYCQELANESYLVIIRGGVKSLSFKEFNNSKKQNINFLGKQKIAQQAMTLIEDNDVIFLDAGTSVIELAKIIPSNKKITIFTNNTDIIPFLSDKNITTYLIGGKINFNTSALTGSLTLKIISSVQFTLAFLGCNGFDEKEIYTTNLEEALIKEEVIKNSLRTFFLADKTKAGKKHAYKVITTNQVTLIKQ